METCERLCSGFKRLATLTFLCTGVAAAGWVTYVIGMVIEGNRDTSHGLTGFSSTPIWMVAVGAPLGIAAIPLQALHTICRSRVRNKVIIVVWSPIFVLFVISPMIFCGYLLYWPVVVDIFSPVDIGIREPIMYVGMLIITIFEGGALLFLVMLMQWEKESTAPMATEDAITSSRPI